MHYNKKALRKYKKLIFLLITAFFFDFTLFPMPTLANQAVEAANQEIKIAENIQIDNDITTNSSQAEDFINRLPVNNNKAVMASGYHVITAYNSEASQCDGSPCTTANGFNVCEHGVEDTVAANFLRFGTKVKIPDHFGDRVFVVRDRMNPRFPDRMDIWMIHKTDAIAWGAKTARVEVIE